MKGEYFIGADGGLIMFDITSRVRYKNESAWYRDLSRASPNESPVLLGNMVDI